MMQSAIVSLRNGAIAHMQRDMDLIRQILSQVKARTDLNLRPVVVDGYDALMVNRHVEMLAHAGYLDAICKQIINTQGVHCVVRDLTMEGHDFAAAIENEGVWAKIKSSLSADELASVPLSIIKDAAVGILKVYLMQKLGLSH